MTADPPPRPRASRLVLVDGDDLVRAGLRSVLSGEPGFEIVGEARTGRDALAVCRQVGPDVVLMDVRLPDLDGIAVTRELRRQRPRVRVLIVTASEDPDSLFASLRAGAVGYVLHSADRDELVRAIRLAVRGESLVDPLLATQLLRRLAAETHAQPRPLPEPLTAREVEVLQLLSRGGTNREIADALVVAVGTVKTHVEHILGKLGVTHRTEAAVRAIELGLVQPDTEEPGPARPAR